MGIPAVLATCAMLGAGAWLLALVNGAFDLSLKELGDRYQTSRSKFTSRPRTDAVQTRPPTGWLASSTVTRARRRPRGQGLHSGRRDRRRSR
jgi:hypothetical protein